MFSSLFLPQFLAAAPKSFARSCDSCISVVILIAIVAKVAGSRPVPNPTLF